MNDFDETLRLRLSRLDAAIPGAANPVTTSDTHSAAVGHGRLTLLGWVPRTLPGMAAAMLLLAATAVGAGTLFNRLIDGAPLLENVWARATDIGASVTDAGVTMTLAKAAVDRERVWVALAISSPQGSVDVWEMRVTDANGVVMSGGTGVGSGDSAHDSATLFGFNVPVSVTPAGPFVLEITAVEIKGRKTAGDWRFTFDVPSTSAWSSSPAVTPPGASAP